MGLLDEYGVNTDEAVAPSYSETPPGIYRFEVGDVFVKEGSTNDPDARWIIVSYNLEDDFDNVFEKSELFALPEDAKNPTQAEKEKLGFYVQRVQDLTGCERSAVNDIERDDLIGITGTLQIVARAGKGARKGETFYNVTKVKREERETVAAAAPAATAAAPKAAAVKKAPARATAPENPFANA